MLAASFLAASALCRTAHPVAHVRPLSASASTAAKFVSRNPATQQVIGEYAAATDAHAAATIDKCHREFESWRHQSFEHRAGHVRALARVLRENKAQYALLMSQEMGKCIAEAEGEIEKCATTCEYYADTAATHLADEVVKTDAADSRIVYQPLGVLFAVMPWNFPFWQVFRFAAPALMAGNTAVLKHARNVTGCGIAIEDVFKKAGTPEYVFKNLTLHIDQCPAVIRHPKIAAVSLTGSEAAGTAVGGLAGASIKKTVLELGGSDPFIVLDDANIDWTVQKAVFGRMMNCGQSCIGAKRFLIHESVAPKFIEQFAAAMSSLTIGDPLDRATNVGPLAESRFADEMSQFVADAKAKGAKIVTGGSRPASLPSPLSTASYFLPTVVAGVTETMRLYHEEAFGPVASIITFKTDEEALRIANGSRFGLGGSVWTRDRKRGEAIARRVESGSVFVNGVTRSDPRLPFGGIKMSGYGRELSSHGIKELCNTKTLWMGDMP